MLRSIMFQSHTINLNHDYGEEKMLIKIGSAGLLLMFATLGTAQTPIKLPECRIDIVGQGTQKVGMVYETGSKGMNGANADWLKEDRDKRLVITAPVSSEWKTCEFSFTPKNSGSVELILMGNSKQYLVWFDSVKISGAELVNGDLEAIDEKGQPRGWVLNNSPIIMTDGKANDGKTYAKVSHDRRIIQKIKVEQGKPVKVGFAARCGDPIEPDTVK